MDEHAGGVDPRRWWVLLGISVSGILVAIDFTIVNMCLPTIQHYFSVSTNILQWLMLGFGITFAACLASAGNLADIVGRRKVLYASITLFVTASLGAGLSPNIDFLIVMRFLQGLASAAIFPCGTAIIASTFPASERSTAIGIYGSTLGVGLAVGPVLGGLIVSYLSWQWIFFINIPTSLFALFICVFIGQLKESKHMDSPPIDWLGTFSLIVAVAGFCFIMSQGEQFGWSSATMVVSAVVTLAALVALVIDMRVNSCPVLPKDLLCNRAFLLGSVVYITTVSVTWVVVFYMPLYLRLIAGMTIAQASLWFSIMTIMTVITPAITGYIYGKYSKCLITHISILVSLIGFALVVLFSIHTPPWLMVVAFLLIGSAWGAGNGLATPIGLLSIKGHGDAGVVSGAMLTVLNVIGTLLVAISTKIFTAVETATLIRHLKQAKIALTPVQVNSVKAWLSDPEQSKQLISQAGHRVADKVIGFFHASFMSGFSHVFAFLALLVFVLYISSWRSISILLRRSND